MEVKKREIANLETQRPTFLLIGLIFSFGITLQSFEWLKGDVVIKSISAYEDESIYSVINEVRIARPEPQKQQATSLPKRAKLGPVIVIEEPLTTPDPNPEPNPDPSTNPLAGFDLTVGIPTIGNVAIDEIKEDLDVPFDRVEVKPEYIGGAEKMIGFISKNTVYPSVCVNQGIEGKVFVTFIIDKEGNVTNAEIARGVNKHLDKEALRVINKMPKWKPGYQRGKAVNVKYTIPVTYILKS